MTEGADDARSCRNASPTEVGTADSENLADRSRVEPRPRALKRSRGIALMLVAMPQRLGAHAAQFVNIHEVAGMSFSVTAAALGAASGV